MQKVIAFDKNLEFKTMVGEITSISLDQQLSFSDDSTISGELIVSGKYKLTAASRLEEDFIFHLPIEIVLTERLESNNRKASIEDFRYEIRDDDTLDCHIELLIEGVEVIDVEDDTDDEEDKEDKEDMVNSIEESTIMKDNKEEILEEEHPDIQPVFPSIEVEQLRSRECDSEIEKDSKSDDVAISEKSVDTSSDVVDNAVENQDVGSLFSSFKDSDETYATYSVYIFRQNDTIESIMDKYQVTKEELESYNDLSNLTIGSKLIIPTHSNE
ncbi:MAG TPA: LysM peptidoglycan-binding domain-containing protein [Candidatus Faecimonas gallistercoris]|nr:LysM peptidoglycan-binding domain-containing protein [Candidatus Faecimonas gallistercoris]